MAVFFRKSSTPARPHPLEPQPDERIYGRNYHGPRPWVIGAAVLFVVLVLSYLAFVKTIPFVGKGYELHATFQNATTLSTNAAVRIAGVNVGKVTSVDAKG